MAADFNASPLWTLEGNIPIEDLPLSPRLNAELHRWAEEFDATTPRGPRMKRGGTSLRTGLSGGSGWHASYRLK